MERAVKATIHSIRIGAYFQVVSMRNIIQN